MGLDSNGIKFLLYAKKLGVDFAATAMIGRQFNHTEPAEIRRLFVAAQERELEIGTIQKMVEDHDGFSEGIFRALGADSTDSFDASAFEGATHVHDLNHPIADQFKKSYTTVFDGGTLEHIFNYPTALKNCMEMISERGHFLALTPVNNFPGHGFYQFGPDLFFRALSPDNGFEIVDMILIEDVPHAAWYRVSDPQNIGRRVTFENTRPAYLFVIARRTLIKAIFESFPQQSDYTDAWANAEVRQKATEKPRRLVSRIPGAVIRRVRRLFYPRAIRHDPYELSRFEPFPTTSSSKQTL